MSHTWFINLENRISRDEFNSIAKKIGIVYSPKTIGGNTYYDGGFGGIEIDFGGIVQQADNTPHTTQLTVSTFYGKDGAYEAMKKTTQNLGKHLLIKDISGDWFNDITEINDATDDYKPFPYIENIFDLIEQAWKGLISQS